MKLPTIITGGDVPDVVYRKIEQEEQQKKQNRHDWYIGIFGVVGGGIMGFVTSLIFWLCTK